MEKVSAACAMEWSIKLEKFLRSKNPLRAVEAILETVEKLKQWSKEPESAVSVYNLYGLVPEEDRLFAYTILLRLADAFCFGDKVVKVAVVRVFMSTFKLSRGKDISEYSTWFVSKAKVPNHLEMLKRVKSVYEEGDFEAKALALVLFGCWRDFANEFVPVRYLIFTSMVSSHDLEICMKLMRESSNEDNLVPFLVSLTKLASRSTHLASQLAEVIMPFLGEDKTSHVRAAVLRCLHFLIKRGMCFSLIHESETAKFSSIQKQEELSPDMQLKALQIFQPDIFFCLKWKILTYL